MGIYKRLGREEGVKTKWEVERERDEQTDARATGRKDGRTKRRKRCGRKENWTARRQDRQKERRRSAFKDNRHGGKLPASRVSWISRVVFAAKPLYSVGGSGGEAVVSLGRWWAVFTR
jgi:hypothetical protein